MPGGVAGERPMKAVPYADGENLTAACSPPIALLPYAVSTQLPTIAASTKPRLGPSAS